MIKSWAYVLLVVCFLFASCVSRDEPEGFASGVDAPSPADSARPVRYKEVFDAKTDFDNRFATIGCGMAVDEATYYFSRFDGNYLYYYDIASGESGVLCSKPQCEHDSREINRECDGFVRISSDSFCVMDNKIYYIGYVDPSVSPICAALYRMDNDGTNKERLFALKSPGAHSCADFSFHRGKVYGSVCYPSVEDGKPFNVTAIDCWDMETGEVTELFSEKVAYTFVPALHFLDRYLYFCIEGVLSENANVEIFRWDSVSAELQKVFSDEGAPLQGYYYDIWVEAEDEICLSSLMHIDGSAPVYLVQNGMLDVIHEDKHAVCMLTDGAAIGVKVGSVADNDDPRSAYIEILGYNGKVYYSGRTHLQFFDQIPFGGFQVNDLSLHNICGSYDEFYVQFTLGKRGGDKYSCFVRFDLIDGELHDTLLLLIPEAYPND